MTRGPGRLRALGVGIALGMGLIAAGLSAPGLRRLGWTPLGDGAVDRGALRLRAPAAGLVLERPAALGQAVSAGDPLVVLDPAEAELELQGAMDAVAGLQSALDLMEEAPTGADPIARERLTAELLAASARADLAALQLAARTVRAPAPGWVGGRPGPREGERAEAGDDLLVLILDEAPRVTLRAPAALAGALRPGQPARVELRGRGERPATVCAVGAPAGAGDGLPVELCVDDPALPHGLPARAWLVTGAPAAAEGP